jgi:hypothetical protein
MIKYAIDPKTLKIKSKGDRAHYQYLNASTFDRYVRVIHWPEHKRVYFRFYKPDGDYSFTSDIDHKRSYAVCSRVLSHLVDKRLVKQTDKVLYWETDSTINGLDVKP